METIGKRIQLARIKKNLNQKTLATEIGIDAHLLSDIEQDKKSPSYDLITKIADKLEVPVIEILPLEKLLIIGNNVGEHASTIQNYNSTDNNILNSMINRIIDLEIKLYKLSVE